MGSCFSKPVPKSPDTGKVKSKRDSAEYRAFRKCFSVLADGITDPGRLAVQLYSRELIGPDIRTEAQKPAIAERVKIEMLLSAVEDQIVATPATKFREFLDVLQSEPSLQHLATRLENTQLELSGKCTAVPPPTPNPSLHMSSKCCQPPPSPRPGVLQSHHSLERTIQQLDVQHNHQILMGNLHTQPTNSDGQSSAVVVYASYLKSAYTREKQPIYDKWPQVKSEKYINLALIEKDNITKQETNQFMRTTIHGNIDDITNSKRATDIGQIAQLPDGSQPKCILVEGAPGVGKSTFAWELCHKWGNGKLLQQYQLVVLLRLRDKSVRTAKNMSNLFQYHNHQVQQAAVEEIQGTGGKGVLLLFEGYDELPEDLRTESSVFLDVITGRELPEVTVLITSRPWASEFLHRECKRCISQHIEILGFTKDNIQSYLESTIPDDPSLLVDLKKYISCYPHINSMMYIPLNSAIVVEVYRNSRKGGTLVPKTMTDLYSSLVRSLLLRHLLDHPVHSKKRRWRVRSFNDLPQDVYQQLCELGRIAYEGILHDQQVIFSDLPEDFETLGLMQCAPELYADEGAAISYNFLHLTVQEYLAAFHLSQQPVEKQIDHFSEYKRQLHYYKRHHFHMVLQFLCGLREFDGYSIAVLSTLILCLRSSDVSDAMCLEIFGCIPPARVIHDITFDSLHWLFEVQDSDTITKLLGSTNVYISNYQSTLTPFDCFVLGYCVSHSNCTWEIGLTDYHIENYLTTNLINFIHSNIGEEGVEMFVRGAVEEETHCTGGISEIDLRSNDITSEGVKHLLKLPKQLINKLKILNLHHNKLDSESCVVLAHLIPHVPHLKWLYLSDNPDIGQGGAVPLLTSLTVYSSLVELDLHRTGIGVEDCQVLSELLSSSTSLRELDIKYNDLPPEAIELIISGLHHNTSLKELNMSNSHFSLQNTISLASVLRTNHTLVDLSLYECNIDTDGACQLASALCTNDILQELNLSHNPIKIEGAIVFVKMLKKSLKKVKLSVNEPKSEEGIRKLIDASIHDSGELHIPKSCESLIASIGIDRSRVKFY